MDAELWRVLQADLYRYRAATDRRALRDAWLREPGFRFTWYLRKVTHFARHKRGLGVVRYAYYRQRLRHYQFRYGFEISPLTTIGPGLYIGHFGGVTINRDAVLGTNVNIAKGVTIGQTNRGSRSGTPVIGDRVWIGVNATVVGRITIGDDALIAPGAYVNFDVPSRAVVLGNPGKIVSDAGSTGYVNNLLPRD